MKSRFGYEMHPQTLEETLKSAREQSRYQTLPDFVPYRDAVVMTSAAFTDWIERFLLLEARVSTLEAGT